jgi:acetyl-CoA synthetase (ADP-forming)
MGTFSKKKTGIQMDLIKTAVDNGWTSLSEYSSKQVLGTWDIPVTREFLVQNFEEAAAAAEEIGYPVVLKPCSRDLIHKSELNCIELGLTGPEAVERAFGRIREKMTTRLEGILVQEMVAGDRELVAGLSRDPQFGVCVMLGFGGVMAEVIAEPVFRVAPFDRIEAMDMIRDLKYRAMLDAFRGQAPADVDTLCRILVSIGLLGLEQPEIGEVDINPLIISPDGTVKAVDALIVLEGVQR